MTGLMNVLRTLRSRLADERGIALVMSLTFMLILAVVMTAAIGNATSSVHHANYSKADQVAMSLAEAGLSEALSVLAAAQDASFASAVPTRSRTLEGGTVGMSGTWDDATDTWTLYGTGTVANPAAPGSTVTRTVSQKVRVSMGATPLWSYLYHDDPTSCMTVKNNAIISSPLYVRGDLCLSPNSHITGSDVSVQVIGTARLWNNATIGYSNAPVREVKAGGCADGGGPPRVCLGAADRVYAQTLSGTPAQLTKPQVDLPFWYENARPGPKHACTSGSVPGGFDVDQTMDGDRAAFDLSPDSTDYSCRYLDDFGNVTGELTWTRANATLTIKGTIFFDGSLTSSSGTKYVGRGAIYSSGSFTLTNGATLCGISGCTSAWDPDVNLLVVIAGTQTAQIGALISNNAVYQGALYVVGNYQLSNNAVNWGPVIANRLDLANNGVIKPLTKVPAGAPGISQYIAVVPGSWQG